MSAKFMTPGEMVSATTVADNLMMAMFFLVLFAVPSINFIRNKFQTPHIDEIESRTGDEESETAAASFWERNEMSLKDIALSVASAFVLVTISFKLADFIGNVFLVASDGYILLSIVCGFFVDLYFIFIYLVFIIDFLCYFLLLIFIINNFNCFCSIIIPYVFLEY